ncbi:MAG: NAD(P)/FAD-dependent oxidoreductase [Terracidiphilus sp.]
MESCSVLIVGGGPAGSSCARKLHDAGLDTILLDKSPFPRNKVCGGWITPAVFEQLDIDPDEYASGRVMQVITGFRTSLMGSAEIETEYGRTVSYGIRRFEFDDYLLSRCGAQLRLGTPLKSIVRSADGWIVNGQIRARLIVGAGGHFCPVARYLGAQTSNETPVTAQEVELQMSADQLSSCSIRGNIGLGRLDPHSLPIHVAKFVRFLKETGKVAFDLPLSMRGHAYLIQREAKRKLVDEGILLIGDAAGLAYSQSGEGILPAIESGLLAAKAILEADGQYNHERLNSYCDLLASRFGASKDDWTTRIGRTLPQQGMQFLARMLLGTRWFSRHVVLDRWFLRIR